MKDDAFNVPWMYLLIPLDTECLILVVWISCKIYFAISSLGYIYLFFPMFSSRFQKYSLRVLANSNHSYNLSLFCNIWTQISCFISLTIFFIFSSSYPRKFWVYYFPYLALVSNVTTSCHHVFLFSLLQLSNCPIETKPS